MGKGYLEKELKYEARVLGIDNDVIFTGERLDIPEILNVFDLYVLPSLSEGLPLVLLEAMAAQCAIITTNVGGSSTIVKDRVNGSLIPAKSPEILEQIRIILSVNWHKICILSRRHAETV